MKRVEERRRRRKERAQDRKEEDEKKDGEGRRGTAEEGRRPHQQWHTFWTPEASVVCVCALQGARITYPSSASTREK